MGWASFRKHKKWLLLPVALAGLFVLWEPDHPACWVALGIVAAVTLAYIADEIRWNVDGAGRPCPQCGRRVKMRSFQVKALCPYCGQDL